MQVFKNKFCWDNTTLSCFGNLCRIVNPDYIWFKRVEWYCKLAELFIKTSGYNSFVVQKKNDQFQYWTASIQSIRNQNFKQVRPVSMQVEVYYMNLYVQLATILWSWFLVSQSKNRNEGHVCFRTINKMHSCILPMRTMQNSIMYDTIFQDIS